MHMKEEQVWKNSNKLNNNFYSNYWTLRFNFEKIIKFATNFRKPTGI